MQNILWAEAPVVSWALTCYRVVYCESGAGHIVTITTRLLCSCTPVAGGQAASGGLHIISSSGALFFTLHIAAGPRPAGDRGNARGRVGVWEQCSGGGAAGRIVAVSALSPEHQQDAAADYVARRLRQITPTWGHSDDGNMLTNSSLLAHVNWIGNFTSFVFLICNDFIWMERYNENGFVMTRPWKVSEDQRMKCLQDIIIHQSPLPCSRHLTWPQPPIICNLFIGLLFSITIMHSPPRPHVDTPPDVAEC